jgi:phosphopantothenoylcysteine synthetase/decarboxylase
VPTDRPLEPARTLYVIVCGAGPATDVASLVRLAQRRGWQVCVITTPAGAEFVDKTELERLTGYPVRSEFRKPVDPEPSLPLADAIVVAPATINMVCKWAAGIADNLALSILFECMGVDVPIVVAPNVNPALARHPTFQYSVKQLRDWRVQVLYERSAPPPVWMPSWERVVEALPLRRERYPRDRA